MVNAMVSRFRWKIVQAAFAVVGFAVPAGATSGEATETIRVGGANSEDALLPTEAEPVRPLVFVAVGPGYPEYVNARVGVYLVPRLTLETVYGLVESSHMVGLGLTGYVLGESRVQAPPTHALTMSLYLRNNLFRPMLSDSTPKEFGVSGELAAGYAYHGEYGAVLRAELVGMTLVERHTLGFQPLLRVSAGWTFPFRR